MKYYTYIYYDPSKNHEPIYVGKGSGYRAYRHLKLKGRNPFISRLKSMNQNNINPMIGIYSDLDEELAFFLEEELISLFGRKDLGKGPLLNLTDGGEGSSNVNRRKDPWNKGIPMSNETKKKISNATKGRKHIFSEEHRLNLSKSKKGCIGTMLGKKHSPETVEKMKLARKLFWEKK